MKGLVRAIVLAACLGALLPGRAQEPQAAPAIQSPGLVSSLLDKAKAYLGTPYHYGGTTPKGFDCSGFVRFVFGTFGFGLERSSGSQANQGEPVDLKQHHADWIAAQPNVESVVFGASSRFNIRSTVGLMATADARISSALAA